MNFIKKYLNKPLLCIIRFINHIDSIYFKNYYVNPDDIYHIINNNLNNEDISYNEQLKEYILVKLIILFKSTIKVSCIVGLTILILGLFNLVNSYSFIFLFAILIIALYCFIKYLKSKLDISFNKSKCFMIEGPWGIGKTYTFNTRIKPELAKLFKNIYYVSLSGLKTQDEIRAKIISKYKIFKNYHFIFFILGVSFFILWLFAFVNTKDSLALYNQCDNCLIISFNYFPNFISNKIIELWPYIGTLIKTQYLENIIQIVLWITIGYWVLCLLGYKFLISFISSLSKKHFGFDIADEKLDLTFINNKDTLLVFDDLERVAEDTDIKSILGFIGNLKEVYGFNIILICNEEELKKVYERDNYQVEFISKKIDGQEVQIPKYDKNKDVNNNYKRYKEKFVDKTLYKTLEFRLKVKIFKDKFDEYGGILILKFVKNIENTIIYSYDKYGEKEYKDAFIDKIKTDIRLWQRIVDNIDYLIQETKFFENIIDDLKYDKNCKYFYNEKNNTYILEEDLKDIVIYILFFSVEYSYGSLLDFKEYVMCSYEYAKYKDNKNLNTLYKDHKYYFLYKKLSFIAINTSNIYIANMAYNLVIGKFEDVNADKLLQNKSEVLLRYIFKHLVLSNILDDNNKKYFINNFSEISEFSVDNWEIIKGFIRNHTFDQNEEDKFIDEFKKLIKKSDIFMFYRYSPNYSINTDNEFLNRVYNICLEYLNKNRLIKTKEYFDSLSETKTIIKNDIIDLLFSEEFKTDAEDYVKKYPITNKQIIDYLKSNDVFRHLKS